MSKFIKILGSLKFGIVLIIIIAIFIILGAIIPQVDSHKILHSKFPHIIKETILLTGTNNIYHSFIFLFLLVLFFINLFICTYNSFIVKLKLLKKDPLPKNIENFPFKLYLPLFNKEKLIKIIKKQGYNILTTEPFIYANKSSWTRYGSFITHISLFLLLIGVIIGILYGFNTNINLLPEQQLNIRNIIENTNKKGILVHKNYDWDIMLNKFWIEYFPDGNVKQYYSNISIIKDKKEILNKTIWVNEPLIYDGVYFYQSSWGITGIKVKFDRKIEDIELQGISDYGYVSKIYNLKGKKGVFYFEDNKLYFIDKNFTPLVQFTQGKPINIRGSIITYIKPLYFSGLQIKSDKGLPIVWISFTITMIGLIMVLWGYKQIVIIEKDEKYYLYGKTSKNVYSFENELKMIIEELRISI